MYKNKISAVYKIVNTVTGDCYVGSSKNVKQRWAEHKSPSKWKWQPNNPLYLDMQKYGVDKFRFQILAPVMPEYLKSVEQEFIEMVHPAYNNYRAKGLNVEIYKETHKRCHREYYQSEVGKKAKHRHAMKYNNQLCSYNGETLTLNTLATRFYRAGIEHPYPEAKKYLLN